MKQLTMLSIIAVFNFLILTNSAYAEIYRFKSKIADINTQTNYLKLYHLDEQTEKVEEIKVDIDASTQFGGAASLRDLSQGEEVAIEVNRDAFSNEWTALQIVRTAPNRLRQVAIEESPRPVRDSAKDSGRSLAKVSVERTS